MPEGIDPQFIKLLYWREDGTPCLTTDPEEYQAWNDTFNICDGCGNSYARCTCDEEDDE